MPRRTRPPVAPKGAEPPTRWRSGLAVLFLVAAAWRWAYLARLGHTPLARSLNADARIYWLWSDTILRHGVLPPAPFFLAPLYPYVLAILRALTGGGIVRVLAVQSLLGAAAVVLLADAIARLAGRRIALALGVVLALFQLTTFFDGLLLPESVLFAVESLLVWFVVRTDWPRARLAHAAGYGALVGVLALGRASHAVLLLLAVPLVALGDLPVWHRVRALAVATVAFGACCLPATLANRHASGEGIPLTYNLGYNLCVGNNPEADGGFVDIIGGSNPVPLEGTPATTGGALDGRAFVLASEGRRMSPWESSQYWQQRAIAFVRAQPLRALGLAGRKLLLAWSRREIPQIETMRSHASMAGPLGLPVLGSFGFLAIAGLSGAVWAVRRSRAERWLAGYLALMTLALLPFFVTDRYRVHLIPALAVLAGVGLAEWIRVARRGVSVDLLLRTMTTAFAAALVFAPVGKPVHPNDEWTIAADRAMHELDRGDAAAAAGDFARAGSARDEGSPESLSTSARTDLAAFHFRYGIALEALGRPAEAIAQWERAVAIDPGDAASLGRLSLAYDAAGRVADGERVRRRLAEVPGGRGQLLVNAGWASAARGDLATAEQCFQKAVVASPDLSVAWEGLIRVRIQTGRIEAASRTLDQARGSGLDPLAGEIYDCYLALQRNDFVAARRALATIPSDAAPSDVVLARLLDQSRRQIGGTSTR